MEFDFYYGSQADQFSFIKIPRAMIADEVFTSLSIQAKILYSILLDRMTLSRKNGWFDEQNRVFIIYPITEIQSDLGFSKKKAMDYLAELEQFGLVLKKKRGFGLPSIIYVKSFLIQQKCTKGIENGTSGVYRSSELGTSGGSELTLRGAEIDTSRVLESIPQEVPKSAALISKTDRNKTDWSKTESNHIVSSDNDEMGCDPGMTAKIRAYEKLIKENIEYDVLLLENPYDQELVHGIFQLILETVLSKSETILIARDHYPNELVRDKFLNLKYSHIHYVLGCLRNNTTKVKNIKKYLLAALFNAPSTMEGYYRAEVNHDMPQFAG